MDSHQKKDITNKDHVKYTLHLDKELGKGMFGKVYKANYAPGQQFDAHEELAVKVIQKATLLSQGKTQADKDKLIERLRSEVETWKKGSHPNIVKFLDFVETQNSCYFVSEYCEGPTLERMLVEKGRTDEATAITWFKGLASAISYLHSQKIIHRDIKPANIIFKQGVPKIVDFGFAKQFRSEHQVQTVGIGTPKYMSPELLESRDDYTSRVDIWALGWTFFEVLYGSDPWPVENVRSMEDLLNTISDQPLKFPKNPKISEKTKDILSGMLQIEQEDRLDHLQLKESL